MMTDLIVFDFDHTLMDDNTDYKFIDMDENSSELLESRKKNNMGWSVVMSTVMSNIRESGVSRNKIEETLKKIPFVEGMLCLLDYLNEHAGNKSRDISLFVLSHANTFFISTILSATGYESLFAKVFSFPARWTEEDRLVITPYHLENQVCSFCPKDFCKGKTLEEDIKSSVENQKARILYIGDGKNDFCAALNLEDSDYILYREGYALEKFIKQYNSGNAAPDGRLLKAQALPWKSGQDLMHHFKSLGI